MQTRSCGVNPIQAPLSHALLIKFRCVSNTPLGVPVVPEVYWIFTGSVDSTGVSGNAVPSLSMRVQESVPSQMVCSNARSCPVLASFRMAL